MWLSIALVVVCSFMSVGGTVAWFTDTVCVESNIVVTGATTLVGNQ